MHWLCLVLVLAHVTSVLPDLKSEHSIAVAYRSGKVVFALLASATAKLALFAALFVIWHAAVITVTWSLRNRVGRYHVRGKGSMGFLFVIVFLLNIVIVVLMGQPNFGEASHICCSESKKGQKGPTWSFEGIM
jgi:hypothetical protein